MLEKDNRPRLLIIDDDEQIRTLLFELLGEDYHCTLAASAEQALALLPAEDFALILTDLHLEGLSGLELLPRVRQQSPESVVMIISGEHSVTGAVEALHAGAFDYLTKPFNFSQVTTIVKRALAHHHLRSENRRYENHLRLLESIAVNANDAIIVVESPSGDSSRGQIIYVNKAFTQMTGYAESEIIGRTPRVLQGLKTDRAQLDKIRAALGTGQAVRAELINYRKDNSEFWVELNIVPVVEDRGDAIHWVSVQREVTDRKHAEEALRISEERFFKAFNASPDPMIISRHADGRYLYVNNSFLRATGYAYEEVINRNTVELKIWADPEEGMRLAKLLAERGQVAKEEVEFRLKSGEVRTGLFAAEVIDVEGELCVLSLVNDITERKQAQAALRRAHDELEARVRSRTKELTAANESLRQQIAERERAEKRLNYLSYHDSLTKLPNRVLFEDRLAQVLLSAQRNRETPAVMLINIDRFKAINDSLGHSLGDLLLCIVADRLKGGVRATDTAARFGGDEFAILLTQIKRSEDAVDMAQRINELLQPVIKIDEHELYLTASVGIALYPEDGSDIATLERHAGAALHRAKERGTGGYEFYAPGMSAKAMKRLTLENELRRAIEREEFVIYYQPQVNAQTLQIVGMEALVRWEHQQRGLVLPGEFISLAEDTGLILPLGNWVLQQACAQNRAWQLAGFDPLRVSVNLSPRLFSQPDLLASLADVLRETQLPPHYVDLEITESSLIKNIDVNTQTLHSLREMGVRISIDDFGTGYSSLSYLKELPINILKIDRSFVQDAPVDAKDAAIVTAIITLAHSLELNVIAEGVETQEQLNFLRLLKCDEIQGFYFSTPLPADVFQRLWLEQKPHRHVGVPPLSSVTSDK
jgi:diguanylate cyclase (GGDEF)-like protein/PAS domain S-box-containing protein